MFEVLGTSLCAASMIGLALVCLQSFATWRFLRRPAPQTHQSPRISILKPLCGVDDELERNLALFATLDYPHYEVVLGVRDRSDRAYPVARAAVARWPSVFRLALQRGEPGLNPKVNQLIPLAAAARHDILVISDSNIRVPSGYLGEIAALLEDPQVGLVTHAVVGVGDQRLGSLMDNLHLTAGISGGIVAAKEVCGQDLVVGKSMAFRRQDLRQLGGMEAFKDFLAEDFVMGRRTSAELGKRVAIARTPVFNVSQHRGVRDFLRRFQRWGVMQRMAVGTPTYIAQSLINPLPLAFVGALLAQTQASLGMLTLCLVVRILADGATSAMLRPDGASLRWFLWSPAKDFVLAAAWLHGLFNNTVNWREHVLSVTAGTRLVPLTGQPVQVPAVQSDRDATEAQDQALAA